jgi:hypoxanthine phosphoribosyltransferase
MTAVDIDGHVIDVLFGEAEIARRVAELGVAVAAARPVSLLVLPILKGSFVFAADLLRALYHADCAPRSIS